MTILLYFSKYHSTALRLVYTYFFGSIVEQPIPVTNQY